MTRNHAISLPQHPPGHPGPLSSTQASDATDTAFSTPKTLQLSTINFPPSALHHLLTATTLPSSTSFHFITASAIYRVFYEAKSYVSPGT